MQFNSSTAPLPSPEHEPQTTPSPGPAIVPPAAPHKRRRIVPWGIFLAGIAVVGGLAYYLRTAKATGGGSIVQISTTTAMAGEVNATIRVNGTIAAANRANILAPRIQGNRSDVNRGGDMQGRQGGRGGGGGGSVMMVMGVGGGGPQNDFSLILLKLAKPGDRVKAGDVVAQFDPQLQQQRLDDYKDGLLQQDAQIKAALANMQAQREQHTQQVRRARASWDKAVQDVKKGPVSADIDKQLYELSEKEMKATYDQLLYEDDLVDQQQRVQIHQRQLNREQQDLELKRTEANLGKMTVKAPMDGIVVMASITRNGEFGQVREGDEVRPGQPFMYIVDPRSMVLDAGVNQVDAEKLRLGMKARIRLDAYSDIEVSGTLIGIGAMSKTSTFRAGYVGEIPVKVRLDKMDERIIPDLTASAEIVLGSEFNAVLLPRTAIFEDNGNPFVFLQKPDGWVRQPVNLGLTSFTTAAVKSGVQKGDVVAIERPSFVRSL
ncbi:MAG: HlyD family efflux transporter periplasmic adaptor subunit [Acidobacteriia bacterium]|nr:HlyD family efflux transporter periplasmic adaptor subunit [Terriglobia bacterium]